MKLKHLLICLPMMSCSASDGGSSAQEGPFRIDGIPEGDGIPGSHSLDSELSREVTTYDDQLAEAAKQVPGFGGMFYDEDGTLKVYMTDQNTDQNKSLIAADVSNVLGNVIGMEAFKERKELTKGFEIVQAQYDFTQLKEWYDEVYGPLLGVTGVVVTDIDEAANRLMVGVVDSSATIAVEEYLEKVEIPREVFVIKETGPINSETLRSKARPLVGGLRTVTATGQVCTIGPIAIRSGVTGYLTAYHCTDVPGALDPVAAPSPPGIPFFQAERTEIVLGVNVARPVGVEAVDPVFFTGGACPANKRCRFSDTAFIKAQALRDPATPTRLGIIARPPGAGSVEWNGTDVLTVTGTRAPIVGETATKVGQSTGGTAGTITGTCMNFPQSGNIVLLCQSQAAYASSQGDSGSAVFRLNPGNNVELLGVHWGSGGVFSPMSGIQSDLGTLTIR